jgi:hypothetical protein
MTKLPLFLLLALLPLASAFADSGVCPGFDASGWVGFTPVAPTSADTVSITVGRFSYVPQQASAQVHENIIDVTLNAHFVGFDPPPPVGCSTTTVGPLPIGSYVVNLYIVDPDIPGSVRVFFTSRTIVVSSATIPSLGPTSLVLLALLLAAAALWQLRSMCASTRAETSHSAGKNGSSGH